MLPRTLPELIEESRRRRADRDRQRDTDRQERERQEEQQFDSVMELAIARIDDSLPEALRPFVVYGAPTPKPAELAMYPDRWSPCDFIVADAPTLANIDFTVTAESPTGPLRVVDISILGSLKYGTDWTQAVADASDIQASIGVK